MPQRTNTTDFLPSTPQWSAYCASEKGVRKKQMPDFVVDKRPENIVTDPVSKKKFYVCHMTSNHDVYKEMKGQV
jgi:hypothetical protein